MVSTNKTTNSVKKRFLSISRYFFVNEIPFGSLDQGSQNPRAYPTNVKWHSIKRGFMKFYN